jgi:hypothetical protein
MTRELAEACGRAMHVVCRDGAVLRAGKAVLFIAGEIGWRRSSRFLSHPPMIWLVELGYTLVARNRQLLGRIRYSRRK